MVIEWRPDLVEAIYIFFGGSRMRAGRKEFRSFVAAKAWLIIMDDRHDQTKA